MPKTKAESNPRAAKPGSEPKTPTKIETLLNLLRRPEGAGIQEMMQATGWQAHSVRGALSGAIKKGLGLSVVSDKTEAGRRYRIATEPQA